MPAEPSEAASAPAPDGPRPGRPRAQRLDARRNRERLLEVARQSFAAEGIAVPVDEIARRAGLGAGTIHRHFPTKESLFEAIVLTHIEDLVARGRELARADDPWAGFVEFCREMVERGRANRALGELLTRVGVRAQEKIAVAVAEFDQVLDHLVVRAQRAGLMRGDLTPAEVRALLNGVHRSAEQSPDVSDAAARMIAVVCDGLRTAAS